MDIDIFEKYSSLFDSGIPDYVFFLSLWVTSITIAILLIIMKGLDVRRTIMGGIASGVYLHYLLLNSDLSGDVTGTSFKLHAILELFDYQGWGRHVYCGEYPQCYPIHPFGLPSLWLQENEQMVEGGAIGMCHLLFYRGLAALAAERALRTG